MEQTSTPKRYRKVLNKKILIDQQELVIDTLPNISLTAPITGVIDCQNGSELCSIPGMFGDCYYGLSYVKETGEIKLYSTKTSIGEKVLMLVIYYELLNEA